MTLMVLHGRIIFCCITLLLLAGNARAQLCQGSLGDPIVKITFGAGANPGAPLKAATTSYSYVSADCPSDGFYTVRSNTTNCFDNSWHSVASDHTGDPNGYFMLINASHQPSAFYIDTVRGLCGGTTYEFAAWIMNVLKTTACMPSPTQPNLTFTIETTGGDILQSYNTSIIGSTVSPTWKQFGFYFTTPASTSEIVLRIFNNAPGGCGNDLALDDITFRPCGPQLVTRFIDNNADSVTVCEGNARSFTMNFTVSTGFSDPSFNWQQSTDGEVWTDIPGETNTSLIRDFEESAIAGKYFYRLSAAEAGNMGSPQCRIASNALLVKVAGNPVATIVSNSPVCQYQELKLEAAGGGQYEWSGVNNYTAQGAVASLPNAQPGSSGKYYVKVINEDGCSSLDSVTVTVHEKPIAAVAFSDTSICEGRAVQLHSSGGTVYQWLPADFLSSAVAHSPISTPATNISYNVIVWNDDGCSDTTNVAINVIEAPTADAGPDRWIIEGSTVQLQGVATGQGVSYAWSPGVYLDNTSSLQPFITPLRDTSYVLSVISGLGCGMATDTMKVFVFKDVFIPNAFSPNNDGLNDKWNIPTLAAYPGFELSVFNRQGQVVFRARGDNRPWDGSYRGQPQPAGIYVYMLDLKDGSAIRKGTLMLVR